MARRASLSKRSLLASPTAVKREGDPTPPSGVPPPGVVAALVELSPELVRKRSLAAVKRATRSGVRPGEFWEGDTHATSLLVQGRARTPACCQYQPYVCMSRRTTTTSMVQRGWSDQGRCRTPALSQCQCLLTARWRINSCSVIAGWSLVSSLHVVDRVKSLGTTGVSDVDTDTPSTCGALGSIGKAKANDKHHPWLSRGGFLDTELPHRVDSICSGLFSGISPSEIELPLSRVFEFGYTRNQVIPP